MKKFFKFAICSILAMFLGIVMLSSTVKAENNKWVLDETNVISEETEIYIQNLNENTFSKYKNKPQLGIMVISKLPDKFSIDEYKLEKFNEYGVGTEKENCGMLFVLSIQDRKYGLEIGDGYEKGTILRHDLETDFITSEMKDLLKSEDYDTVIFKVAKHLEEIMRNEETGVYKQKEEEKAIEEQETTEFILKLLGFFGVLGIIAIVNNSIQLRIQFKNLWKEYEEYLSFIPLSEEEIKVTLLRYYKDTPILERNTSFLHNLYKIYIRTTINRFKETKLKYNEKHYMNELEIRNSFQNFKNKDLTSLETIIDSVDKQLDTEEKNKIKNYENIHDFVLKNKHLLEDHISPTVLEEKMKECSSTKLIYSEETLKKLFDNTLKELNFEEEYELFLKENKDKIDPKFFDSSEFKEELRRSSNFKSYRYQNDNSVWMTALLTSYILHNKEVKAEEQRQEAKRIEEENNSNHFGGGFGGGYSSGGGFSGGW